jgi:methylmalonyl-CoA mutase
MNDPLAAGFDPVSLDEWRQKASGGDADAALATALEDGIETKWLYTAEDALAPDPAGIPGEAPFVRGTRAGRHWQIRQEQTQPDRTVANREILEDLNGGVTEITLRLDGDADGMLIGSLDDISAVLEGVYLDMAGVALDAGSKAIPAAAVLAAHWRETGIAPEEAIGSFRIDPLATLARSGSAASSPENGLRQAASVAVEVSRDYPKVRALGVETSVYVEAGATAAWELGIALSTALEYLRSASEAGLEPAEAVAQIEFTLAVGPDQFLETSKFRAMRRLWARVLEECGVPADRRLSATYARTSGRMFTWIDPWVNMLRGTTAAFAAGTGGADGVTVTPFDSEIGQPGDIGRRIARNTQIVLQDESSLGRIADPAAGSWYVESLTDEVARAGWQRFQQIESEGGALAALRSGLIATKLSDAADRREDEMIHRTRVMTGVNEFPLLGDDNTEAEEVDREALLRNDMARVAERPEITGLDDLEPGALAAVPVGELLKRSVSLAVAGARIDEIALALSDGGGDAGPPVQPLEPRPDAAPFERLRDAVETGEDAGQSRPRIFLACMGPIATHVNFANWAKSFFEVAGIETVPSGALEGNAAQAEAVRSGDFEVVAVCASTREDPAEVADLVAGLREAGTTYVYMVNSTPEINEASGADEVVKNGVDMEAVLTAALERLGVAVDERAPTGDSGATGPGADEARDQADEARDQADEAHGQAGANGEAP